MKFKIIFAQIEVPGLRVARRDASASIDRAICVLAGLAWVSVCPWICSLAHSCQADDGVLSSEATLLHSLGQACTFVGVVHSDGRNIAGLAKAEEIYFFSQIP